MRFVYVQTFFIAFLLFWIIFAYEIDPNSTLGFNAQLPYGLPTILIAISAAGLVLTIGFVTANYRENRKRLALASNVEEGSLRPPTILALHRHRLDNITLNNTDNANHPTTHQAARRQRHRLSTPTRLSDSSPTTRVQRLRALSRNRHTIGKRRPRLSTKPREHLVSQQGREPDDPGRTGPTLPADATAVHSLPRLEGHPRLGVSYDERCTRPPILRHRQHHPALHLRPHTRRHDRRHTLPRLAARPHLARRLPVHVPAHPRLPAANPQRMEEVQDLRKRGNGRSPRIPRSLTCGEGVRAGGTEKQTTSLPLQRQSFRAAQSLRGQRRLQPARRRRHIDRARRGTVRWHPTRPGEHSKPRSAIGRQLLCDTALFSPEKRWTEDPRHTIIARGNRKVPRGPRRDT